MSSFVEKKIEYARSHPSRLPPSPEEYLELLERVQHREAEEKARTRREAHDRVRKLAERQGVKPIRSIKDLQGDFWPEEESVDEFLSWLRATRQEDKHRSIPE